MAAKTTLHLLTFSIRKKAWHHAPTATSLGGAKNVVELEQRLQKALATIAPDLILKGLEVIRVDYQFRKKISASLFSAFSDALVCHMTEFTTGNGKSSNHKRDSEFLFSVDSFDLYEEAREQLSEGSYTVSGTLDETTIEGPKLASPVEDEAAVRALIALLSQPVHSSSADESMRYVKIVRDARTLINESLRLRLQSALDGLAGDSLEAPEDNAELVRLINTERSACNVSLKIKKSQPPVYLRCVASNRKKNATIQAISSGSKRETVYAGTRFPALKVHS